MHAAESIDLVTTLWSMTAATGLLLGLIHFLVWWQNRQATANLAFAMAAISLAILSAFELMLMHTTSPLVFGRLIGWAQVPGGVLSIAVVYYVHERFGTGRMWLFRAAIACRLLVMAMSLLFPPNINYREISELKQIPFLGENVWVVAKATNNPLGLLAILALVMLIGYIADATITLWRGRDERSRRHARWIAGGILFWVAIAVTTTILIHTTSLGIPYFITLPALPLVAIMAWELSRDMLQSARLNATLIAQSSDMQLAARFARMTHWTWDIDADRIWVSQGGLTLYGVAESTSVVTFAMFLQTIDARDRAGVEAKVRDGLRGGVFQAEYRIARQPNLPDRWVSSKGRVEHADDGRPLRMRGVSMDISERKHAEAAANRQRDELAHLARVGSLAELSGALAHELNQPLSVILSNAQATEQLLASSPPRVAEATEVLADVITATHRASEVIRRLRILLEHGESVFQPVDLNQIVTGVMDMLSGEFDRNGITINFTPGRPAMISGDPIQLQQVFLNLWINAMDAVLAASASARRINVTVTPEGDRIVVQVEDDGVGLPADHGRLFDPFFTTKPRGLGMGLAVCRTIIEAHGGHISAQAHACAGTTIVLDLPGATETHDHD